MPLTTTGGHSRLPVANLRPIYAILERFEEIDMRVSRKNNQRTSCRGTAAVELAILLPFIVFLFAIVVDFGRIFYFSQVVENCARAGALYASDPDAESTSPYTSVEQAARADATNLNPQPTVTSTTGSEGGNPYVRVTCTWAFQTVTHYPGVPTSTNLSRTVQMRQVAP